MDRRRWMWIAGVAAACVLATSTGHAASFQQQSGVIASPTTYNVAGTAGVESCPGFIQATTLFAAGVWVQPHFAIDPGTWGRPFTLNPLLQKSNLDISFRVGNGWTWVQYSTPNLKGEKGWVPWGAREAIVCLKFGIPTRFVYRAG